MESLREFVTEFTNVDSKLLRTLATLIVRPRRLIESRLANDDKYTSPLKLWIFTASIFIVVLLLVDWLIGDHDPRWSMPEKIVSRSDVYVGLYQALFPIFVLLSVLPLTALLKIMYLKRSWREINAAMMYTFSAFWLVMTLASPLNDFIENDLLVPGFCLLIVVFTFWKSIADRFIRAFLRWFIILNCTLVIFFELTTPIVYHTFESIALPRFQKSEVRITPRTSERVKAPAGSEQVIRSIQNDDRVALAGIQSNGIELSYVTPQNDILWTTFLPQGTFFRKIAKLDVPGADPLYVVLANVKGDASSAFFLSSKGVVLHERCYEEKLVLNGACILNGTIFISGGRSKNSQLFPFIDAINYRIAGDRLEVVNEKTYFIEKDKERFDWIDILRDSLGAPQLIAMKYLSNNGFGLTDNNELREISVLSLSLDSTLTINWERPIFQKSTLYSPPKDYSFGLIADNHHHQALARYVLSDDSTMTSYLFSISPDGRMRWTKKVMDNNITIIGDLDVDASGIYYCGYTQSGLGNPVGYAASRGFVGYLSTDGEHSGQFNYGSNSVGLAHYAMKIIGGDTVRVFDFMVGNNPLGTGSDWRILTFDKPVDK